MITRVPRAVAEKLGYYVYLYIHPDTGQPFYVGKGKGDRTLAHMSDDNEARKTRTLAGLRRRGLSPRIEVLAHGLADEETAYRIEAAVIDLLQLGKLANEVRGWRSIQLGRIPLDDLVNLYAPRPVEITEPTLLIRINQRYRHDIPAQELYEATRGVWRLGPRREGARIALAVSHGVVRAAFSISSWYPAGTTPYITRARSDVRAKGRLEFVSLPATDAVSKKYVGRSVEAYFHRGVQTPTVYVNC
jgi:uncharacterized protein